MEISENSEFKKNNNNNFFFFGKKKDFTNYIFNEKDKRKMRIFFNSNLC